MSNPKKLHIVVIYLTIGIRGRLKYLNINFSFTKSLNTKKNISIEKIEKVENKFEQA